tara:strand:- start:372 stop:980 length:609 start_codon:yes stop_codon:yes gene_type:complete
MFKSAASRHLLIANALISLAGYASIAWVPVYFQRIHDYSTGESGTFLALAIGVGGGLGTFLGGYVADRVAKFGEGWRAKLVSLTILIYLPFAYLCYSSQDPFWAAIWYVGPAALGGVYLGVNFAILQSLVPVEMRSVAAAINLFSLNIIGLGLGPLSVGTISDLTLDFAGIDSLRYGLYFTLGVILWGALHQWHMGRHLDRL